MISKEEQDVDIGVGEFADAFEVFSAADVTSWSESSAFAAVSCDWPTQGQRCRVLPEGAGLPLEGALREFDRILTEGDGACSIHSLFGRPLQEHRFWKGIFCEDAYPRGALTLEAFLHEEGRRDSWQCLIVSVQRAVWHEFVRPAALHALQLASRPSGRNVCILWTLLEQRGDVAKRVLAHVKTRAAEQQKRDALMQEVRHAFEGVCKPAFKSFVLQLAEALGWLTASLACDGMQECSVEHEGQLYVKGTGRSCKLPVEDPPVLRREAIFDSREAFDTLHSGLLEFRGKELDFVKDTCEDLLAWSCATLTHEDEIRRFRTLRNPSFQQRGLDIRALGAR